MLSERRTPAFHEGSEATRVQTPKTPSTSLFPKSTSSPLIVCCRPWIPPHSHLLGPHPPQHLPGLLHSSPGHMWIRITRPQKHRHPTQISGINIIQRSPNQPTRKPNQPAIPPRIPGHKLRRQTSPLREPTNKNLLHPNPRIQSHPHRAFDRLQRRRKPGLILLPRRQKRIRIPAVPRSLRSKISQPRPIHRRSQTQNILRRPAAPMQHHHGTFSVLQRSPKLPHRLPVMWISRSAHPTTFALCNSITGSRCSITLRRGSSHEGMRSSSPSDSIGSSSANPGGSVASSNNTPPGSRK